MKKIASLSLVLAGLVPSFVFAAAATFFDIMATVLRLMNFLIPILITIAVIYFIWSVIKYTLSTDEEAKSGARSGIITGLVGLFVIISFWGIVYLLQRTAGVSGSYLNSYDIPCVPVPPTVVC